MLERTRDLLSRMEHGIDDRLDNLGFALSAGLIMYRNPEMRKLIVDALASVTKAGRRGIITRVPLWFLPTGEREEARNIIKLAQYMHDQAEMREQHG